MWHRWSIYTVPHRIHTTPPYMPLSLVHPALPPSFERVGKGEGGSLFSQASREEGRGMGLMLHLSSILAGLPAQIYGRKSLHVSDFGRIVGTIPYPRLPILACNLHHVNTP